MKKALFSCGFIFFSMAASIGLLTSWNESALAKSSSPQLITSSKQNNLLANSNYRLPSYAVPVRYDLKFEPMPEKGSFNGEEIIELKVKEKTKEIWLNAKDLKINEAKLLDNDHNKEIALSIMPKATLDRVCFKASEELSPGLYNLRINFTGILNDKLVGFYRSTYKDSNGVEHYLATTQMEPTDARRMFPCFDEPVFKAKYKLKVLINSDLTAISNGAIEKTIDQGQGKKLVVFEETKEISSYLLALCVGAFQSTETITVEGVPIKVWSVGRDPSLGNYARDFAGHVLKYMNSYFGIKYPWNKLDLIAIPDFEAGAMENPGAITFRQTYLLADEKNASLDLKQDIAGTVAHEMAHMWFGDLVTMQWWDDLWLNEAFATWMADKAVDAICPQWNMKNEFFSARQGALRTDSLKSSRSIASPVVKPADALQMFDEITYVKGSSILNMLEQFLGEKIFQQGISNYMKLYSFKNATTSDLWKSLEQVSKKPVKTVMQTWCQQAGYPLVSIKQGVSSSNMAANKDSFLVSQSRFFLDTKESASTSESRQNIWNIPLFIKVLKNNPNYENKSVDEFGRDIVKADLVNLLSKKAENIKIAKANLAGFTANAGGWGFYRVQYPKSVNRLIEHNLDQLAAPERLSFLSDQFALLIANKISVSEYFDTLLSFKNEKNRVVWDVLLKQLSYLDLFVSKDTAKAYASFIRFMLTDEFNRLSWQAKEAESAPVKLTRGQIITWLGTKGEDQAIIQKARELFANYLRKANSVDPDLLDAITIIVAYNGNEKEFEQIKTLWKKADTPEIEKRNLFAMASFRHKDLLNSLLLMTLDKQIRSQDSPHLISAMMRQKYSRDLTWQFMKLNWQKMQKIFSIHMLGRLSGSTDSFISDKMQIELNDFYRKNMIEEGKSDTKRMLERVKINVQFQNKNASELNKWLNTWQNTSKN